MSLIEQIGLSQANARPQKRAGHGEMCRVSAFERARELSSPHYLVPLRSDEPISPSRSGMSTSEAPNPRHQNQSKLRAKSVLTAEQWMNAVSLTSTVTSSALRMSFISSHCNDFFTAPNETLQHLSLQEVRESYSMLNNA